MSGIIQILFWSTLVVWIFPAIRQFRTFYFYYFLILACIDPICAVYGIVLKSSIPHAFFPVASLLSLISIQTKENIIKYNYLYISAFVIILLTQIFANSIYATIVIALLLHLLIFGSFLKSFIITYSFKQSINIFLFALALYELTIILKYFNILFEVTDVTTSYFIITSIVQAFFGLYFSIVRSGRIRLSSVVE